MSDNILIIDHNLLDIRLFEGVPKTTYEGKPFTGVAFENISDGGYTEVVFLGGLMNGLSREWYPNGNQRDEAFMFANVRHGKYWEWYESGKIHLDRTYEFGIKVNETEWDESGRVVSTFTLKLDSASYKSLEISRQKYRVRK